jgi:hypothetical protein
MQLLQLITTINLNYSKVVPIESSVFWQAKDGVAESVLYLRWCSICSHSRVLGFGQLPMGDPRASGNKPATWSRYHANGQYCAP